MDAAKINPFIQGAQMVLNSLCMETPKLGQVFVKKLPYKTLPVSIAIDIIGDFTGEVVFNMEETVGCFIASKMMGGMPVSALDEMAQSAVSEMANMISGNVATIFSGKETKIDIKPPRFKLNAVEGDFPMANQVEKIVCIPLKFTDGHIFELDIILP
jgi:chemotaxis protein CheX